jgi:hypothetical protein
MRPRLLGGCGGSSNDPCSQGSCLIGPNGGTVSLPGGPTLEVSPDALANETTITIQEETTPAPSGALTKVYRFGPEGTTFLKVARVSFFLELDKAPSICWARDGITTEFEQLPTFQAPRSWFSPDGPKVTTVVPYLSRAYVIGGLECPAVPGP